MQDCSVASVEWLIRGATDLDEFEPEVMDVLGEDGHQVVWYRLQAQSAQRMKEDNIIAKPFCAVRPACISLNKNINN
jgi:hypothetical protein